MKLPPNTSRFTLTTPQPGHLPPRYLPIDETNDGAGNHYGLYWQTGKENNDPIVCWFNHEENCLIPEFKDFSSFEEWYNENDGSGPTMNLNDNDFFVSLTNKGKVLAKNGKQTEAIQKLERALSLFSEYWEPWYCLAEIYYNSGEKDKADEAIINAISSNFIFGTPSKKCIDRFNSLQPSHDLINHPLVKNGTSWIKGGDFATPLSADLSTLAEIIEDLNTQNDQRTAQLMKENHAILLEKVK